KVHFITSVPDQNIPNLDTHPKSEAEVQKEKLEKMAKDKPDDLAKLLRSCISVDKEVRIIANTKQLTGRHKAAILLISMGTDVSAEVYKQLSDEEIEKRSLEISAVQKVETEAKDEVVEQFHQIAIAQDYISQGGVGYAKTVLEKAFGKQEAASIINRLTSSLQVRPFDFARKADPQQVLNFIQNEHPQTIALILSYLD